jgi:hypothetical protein
VALALLCLAATSNAQPPAPPQGDPARGRAAAAPADANGFKIGDRVQVLTAFGWIDATIRAANGDNYRVHTQAGTDVTKTYPAEVRRIGPATLKDKKAGQYALHDKVQVNVNGTWMDGEIVTAFGMDYQVTVSGNRTTWATAQQLRLRETAGTSAAPKAGVPPKPGLTSCAGKIEGRYVTSGGFGTMTIVFRSGKAIMKDAVGDNDTEMECWMGGGKVYLHKPGDSPGQDMPMDVNDDGTLQSPFGELKKKGS